MTATWAARLPADASPRLGDLRLREGLEVGVDDDALWLRGERLEKPLEAQLHLVPGLERFSVDAHGHLTPLDRLAPVGRLPALHWQALRQWLRFAPTRPLDPSATRVARVAPSLVRDAGPARDATLLLCPGPAWLAWVETAPAERLRPLRFAVNTEHLVLVHGAPLPGLAGQRFVVTDGVATPAGWRWDPPLESAAMRLLLGLQGDDLAVLAADGTHDFIAAEHFVAASRSAVRLTFGSVPPAGNRR